MLKILLFICGFFFGILMVFLKYIYDISVRFKKLKKNNNNVLVGGKEDYDEDIVFFFFRI